MQVNPATLNDCDREPIHIPGAIQPQGALLVFEDDRLIAWSANAAQVLSVTPALDANLDALGLQPALREGLDQLLATFAGGEAPAVTDKVADPAGVLFSRIVHRHDGRTLVEFEHREEDDVRANLAARIFTVLKGQANREHLLQVSCNEIRQWTGFDRVMAYVFQPDGSGDVVAESRSEHIDSFLNTRFPATDIPAQARLLYILNTLRFIPDVAYQPVA